MRYWRDDTGAIWTTTTDAGNVLAERDGKWQEVTITPVTPSDTLASTKPSDAEHLLSVVETIKETGGSVQIRGVLITPCDTYGQPLTNVHPDADVAERIAGAIVRCADPAYMLSKPGSDDYSDGYRLGIRDAARIARSHAAPPAPSPETPGFEGTRSALDGLTIRKEKTSD